YIFEKLYIHV
uniref:Uncharacterized protein n=1 Tax=Rhodnius prolixus TaxID=13249 RepID=A0A0G2KBG1_RHOPR